MYAAWWQETPVAVKQASLHEAEMAVHAGSHDNVVAVRGLCQWGAALYLVMELCPRGTIAQLAHGGGGEGGGGGGGAHHRLHPSKLLPVARLLARGMLHLHTRKPPVLHRDLKPSNLFLGEEGGGVGRLQGLFCFVLLSSERRARLPFMISFYLLPED